jgi:hypothetical protein
MTMYRKCEGKVIDRGDGIGEGVCVSEERVWKIITNEELRKLYKTSDLVVDITRSSGEN